MRERSVNVADCPRCQGQPPGEPVGVSWQASEIGRGDREFGRRIGLGPRGRLLEVGQGQVPTARAGSPGGLGRDRPGAALGLA